MITEDYVSLKSAKFLREKGFDEMCEYVYRNPDENMIYVLQKFFKPIKNSELIDEVYTAPTLSITMKWLRKVHNLHIEIIWYQLPLGYAPNIVNIKEHKTVASIRNKNKEWDEPEEAIKAAIKYCLENLI